MKLVIEMSDAQRADLDQWLTDLRATLPVPRLDGLSVEKAQAALDLYRASANACTLRALTLAALALARDREPSALLAAMRGKAGALGRPTSAPPAPVKAPRPQAAAPINWDAPTRGKRSKA